MCFFLIELNRLDDPKVKMVRMTRNMILVEENGTVVRYTREAAPSPRPKRTIKANSSSQNRQPTTSTSNAENATQITECRVICHKMTQKDIDEKIKALKKNTEARSQMPLVQSQYGINCNDIFKVVLGKNAYFIRPFAIHSMLLPPFAIDDITQNVEFASMIDHFSRLSLGQPQEQRELTQANEVNLEWINRADTLKLKVGNITYFISKNVMQSILLTLHSLNIIQTTKGNSGAFDTQSSAIYPVHNQTAEHAAIKIDAPAGLANNDLFNGKIEVVFGLFMRYRFNVEPSASKCNRIGL